MIYLFGQFDPHDSEGKWGHKFLTFEDREKKNVLKLAKDFEKKGWDIIVISGKELDSNGKEM